MSQLALAQVAGLVKKVAIRRLQPGAQRRFCAPAKRGKFGTVEKFPRRTIRTAGIECDTSSVTDDFSDQSCERGDTDFFAGANVQESFAGIVLHDEHAGVAKIVGREELTFRRAGAPHRHFLRATDLGLMKTSNKSRRNVTIFRMV